MQSTRCRGRDAPHYIPFFLLSSGARLYSPGAHLSSRPSPRQRAGERRAPSCPLYRTHSPGILSTLSDIKNPENPEKSSSQSVWSKYSPSCCRLERRKNALLSKSILSDSGNPCCRGICRPWRDQTRNLTENVAWFGVIGKYTLAFFPIRKVRVRVCANEARPRSVRPR